MSTSFLRRYELFVKTGLFAFVALGFFLVAHPSYARPSANLSLNKSLIMEGQSATINVSSYHAGEYIHCTLLDSTYHKFAKYPHAYKSGGGASLNVSYTVSPSSTSTYWLQCCGGATGDGNCNATTTQLRVDAGVGSVRFQSYFHATRFTSLGNYGVCMVDGYVDFSKTVSGCVLTPNPPDTYSNLGAVGCWNPDFSKCGYVNSVTRNGSYTGVGDRWDIDWGGYAALSSPSGRTLTVRCNGLYGKVSVTKATENTCPSSHPAPPPPVYTCTGALPANSVMWDAEESSSLSSNTARSYASSDTAKKCQYHCSSGYTWNSSTGTCNLPPALAVCPPTLNLTESGADGNLTAWYSSSGAISCSNHPGAVDVTGTATWSSTDDSIAQVSGGTVSPVGAGNVSVTATYNGLSDFSSVAVALLGAPDLVVCPSTTLNLVEGGANGSFMAWYSSSGAISCSNHSTATDVTSDLSTTWTSADEGVVTVNNGTVVPVGAGSHVAITAEYTGGASPVSDSSSASVLPVGCIPDTSCAANTCVGLTCVDPVCGSSVAGTKSCSSSGGGYKEVSP